MASLDSRSSRPRAHNSTLARGGPLPRVSRKRQLEDVELAALRADLLERFPVCQIGLVLAEVSYPAANRCLGRATEVHHRLKRSRSRAALLDPELCLTACRECHEFTEQQVAESTVLGLLLSSWYEAP